MPAVLYKIASVVFAVVWHVKWGQPASAAFDDFVFQNQSYSVGNRFFSDRRVSVYAMERCFRDVNRQVAACFLSFFLQCSGVFGMVCMVVGQKHGLQFVC